MTRQGLRARLLRFSPLFLLAFGILAFFYFNGASYISMDALKENRQLLQNFVADYGIVAQLGFVLLYILATAFSLPVGAVLTIAAGFLFGPLIGIFIVLIGATIGAFCIFGAVKLGVGESLTKGTSDWVTKMRVGFQQNAFSYLLMLRLIPLFPFALVNIVPALLGVSASTYILATFLGIIPGSLVYVLLGNGLGAIFDAGGTADLGLIFDPEILIPILGLACLVLLQLIYRRRKDRAAAARAPTTKR